MIIDIDVCDALSVMEWSRKKIEEKFTPDGYWKWYSCHAAADNSFGQGQNLATTVAQVFGIKGIGANAWVFIEGSRKTGVYMFPPSRERHREEFGKKPELGIPLFDTLYTQQEAAWVTYTPVK